MDTELVREKYGCAHYDRKCELFCDICQDYFPCRFCHNAEKYDTVADAKLAHQFDRFGVKKIRCLICATEQPPTELCVNESCSTRFASYYCSKCILYDDKGIAKGNFHCDGCGVCRTGGRDSFFHCNTCGICLSTSSRGNHVCLKGRLESTCAICLEDLHHSTRQASLLPCGHALHSDCYSSYATTNYRCPLCKKSIGNMSRHWKIFDEEIASLELTEPLEAPWVKAICYDCRNTSTTRRCLNQYKCLAKKNAITDEEYRAAFASSNPRAYMDVVCGSYNTDFEKTSEDVEPLTSQWLWPWDQFRIEKSLESEITTIEGTLVAMNEHLCPVFMMVFAKELEFKFLSLKSSPYLDAKLVESLKTRISTVLDLNREFEDYLSRNKEKLLTLCDRVHNTAPYAVTDRDFSQWIPYFNRLAIMFGLTDTDERALQNIDELVLKEHLLLKVLRQSMILLLRGDDAFLSMILKAFSDDAELFQSHQHVLETLSKEISKIRGSSSDLESSTITVDDAMKEDVSSIADENADSIGDEAAAESGIPKDVPRISSDASKKLIFSLLFISNNLFDRDSSQEETSARDRASIPRRLSCEAGLCNNDCRYCISAYTSWPTDSSDDDDESDEDSSSLSESEESTDDESSDASSTVHAIYHCDEDTAQTD